ncbi:MAG: septum formation initiator family protein [Pseudomonadota bacterium]
MARNLPVKKNLPKGRRFLRRLHPAVLFCVCLYFGWHTFEGRHGIIALTHYEKRIEVLADKAKALRDERLALEGKVALLDRHGIDPDYLDELARKRLGLLRSDELIVKLPALPEGNP